MVATAAMAGVAAGHVLARYATPGVPTRGSKAPMLSPGGRLIVVAARHACARPALLDRRRLARAAGAALQSATPAPSTASSDLAAPASTGGYPFAEIEGRWQAYWDTHGTFRTPEQVDTSKPKYYVLDMFPYPR